MPVPLASRPPRAVPLALSCLTTVLVLSSCSGGDGAAEEPSPSASPSPSTTVSVPPGAELTEQGASLAFGETATVVFEPDQNRGSVLELTVRGATEGSVRDLRAYELDARTRASAPYYVRVTVENTGEGDVGRTGVPLLGVAPDDTLLPAARFTTEFDRCPSEPLPDEFAAGDTFRTCLVYLVPEGGELQAVSYRPTQEFVPITWTGGR